MLQDLFLFCKAFILFPFQSGSDLPFYFGLYLLLKEGGHVYLLHVVFRYYLLKQLLVLEDFYYVRLLCAFYFFSQLAKYIMEVFLQKLLLIHLSLHFLLNLLGVVIVLLVGCKQLLPDHLDGAFLQLPLLLLEFHSIFLFFFVFCLKSVLEQEAFEGRAVLALFHQHSYFVCLFLFANYKFLKKGIRFTRNLCKQLLH